VRGDGILIIISVNLSAHSFVDLLMAHEAVIAYDIYVHTGIRENKTI